MRDCRREANLLPLHLDSMLVNQSRQNNSGLIVSLMQLLISEVRGVASLVRQFWMVSLLVAGSCAWFLFESGGAYAATSRSVLHGLCAQRPTHSFVVGGELLPFDARMTGIYSGALLSWVALSLRRRLLTSGTPPMAVIATLVIAVLLLAVDGVNALLVDLGQRHPYEPQNAVRFFTGFGTGVALTSLQSWLLGTALFKIGRVIPVWRSPVTLSWVVPASILVYFSVIVAPAWMYPVIALLLMASAWITVTGLVLVIVVSAFRLEARITSPSRLHVPLAESAAIGLGVILALAQGRFWLERALGIPQDFVAFAPETVGTILPLLMGSSG